MTNKPPVPQHKINIELPPEIAEGTYSNLAIIQNSPAEFVLDFTRLVPGVPTAKVYSRIIMAPQHAKQLKMALEEHIKKFESVHGEISVQGGISPDKPFGFQSGPQEDDS